MNEKGPSHNPWFEHLTVGEQWHTHDEAFYNTLQTRFARGAYWFWLFNDYRTRNAPRLCITISHLGTRHFHNGRPVRPTKVRNGRFRGSGMIWAYDGREMEELYVGMMDVRVDSEAKGLTAVTGDGNYRVLVSGLMPHYEIKLFRRTGGDESLLAWFNTVGTGFSNGFEQNPHIKIRSFEGYSDGGDTYAKIDRCSQFPACASNVCDIFAPFEGEFRGMKMKGNTYTERAQSFGIVANWKIAHVTFDDGSRFWLRFFTGKINYHDPLSFFMVHSTTGKRYVFDTLRHVYFTGAEEKSFDSFRPEATRILVEGSGPDGELRIVFRIRGHYLSRYQRMRYEARYYQFVMDVEEFTISADGKKLLSLEDFESYTGYGEETYKLRYKETIREKQVIRIENGAHTAPGD